MGSLNVDYQETRNAGTNLKNHASDFKTLLGEIQSLNDNLKSSWTGDDAVSYTNKITEQAQGMNQLQKTVDEMGDLLISAGNAYEQAMEANKVK